jgi:aspartyl-tRNA(Asn)/glutamyl-tRNA(Gln) amidotransferase subunit A
VPSTAFRLEEKQTDPVAMYLGDIYTVLANLVGTPAISIPLFRHPNGLPFGLQLMTAHFNEVSLLRLSDELLQLSGLNPAD